MVRHRKFGAGPTCKKTKGDKRKANTCGKHEEPKKKRREILLEEEVDDLDSTDAEEDFVEANETDEVNKLIFVTISNYHNTVLATYNDIGKCDMLINVTLFELQRDVLV